MINRRWIIAGAGALLGILALAGSFALLAARPRRVAHLAPRTERAPLARRFPFLGNFKHGSWVSGIAQDRSGGLVPAPSSYFIRAYVVMSADDARELLERYPWTLARGEAIPEPAYPLGEHYPRLIGPYYQSEELIRALPSMTTYSSGKILFQREGNLLYLDLVSD